MAANVQKKTQKIITHNRLNLCLKEHFSRTKQNYVRFFGTDALVLATDKGLNPSSVQFNAMTDWVVWGT